MLEVLPSLLKRIPFARAPRAKEPTMSDLSNAYGGDGYSATPIVEPWGDAGWKVRVRKKSARAQSRRERDIRIRSTYQKSRATELKSASEAATCWPGR